MNESQIQPNIITTASSQNTINCTACNQHLEGNFARALDGAFHWHCFLCIDCNEPVAEKFFPIEFEDGSQKPLCEKDYFKRLNLTCDNCGEILKGSYISAVGKKFHLEHFCCSICSVVFGPDDSYYEHGDNVYCHYHYSIDYAIKCIGCESAILKQFVEINRNEVDEHWHPECYMIQKFWNVKLAQSFGQDTTTTLDLSKMSPDELKETQTIMEEKIYRIWTILSAFEESAAGCISDMLVHVSEGNYAEGIKKADYFVTHVDVLFTAIDELAIQHYNQTKQELLYERESSMLCKKVSNFFSLLSHTQEGGFRKIGVTQDLLSLVTGLAHYLKVLIRIGLTGALSLETRYDSKSVAINQFLTQLMELANKKRQCSLQQQDYTISSDLCQFCRKACEDACFRFKTYIWHDACFACSQCCTMLRDEYKTAYINQQDLSIHCERCVKSKEGYLQGFESVSKLKQSSFLLQLALRRLYSLLNVPDPMVTYYGQPNESLMIQQQAATPPQHTPQTPQVQQIAHQPQTVKSPPQDIPNEEIRLKDIKRMKSTHMNRKMTNSHRIGKRSTLMEIPSPTTAYVSNKTEETTSIHSSRPQSMASLKQHELEGDLSQMSISSSSKRYTHRYNKSVPMAKSFYFSELGTLQHFMLKHIAVLYLEEILHDHFTLEELADLIDDRKNSTLWGKFVTSLKASGNKKVPKSEGTFGVPIDILVEKNGCESNLGIGPTRIIKIPMFIDECLSAMKQMDMSVEGVFRKNGNIRRLKELCDEIDRNVQVQYMNESCIQIAALIKKFLRELPEPLLTYKLHRLFITAQKLESDADRKRVTHLACCLLPKANRDTMEVLFNFMKYVAQFAEDDNGGGNKMHIANLATVIAPNVLYSKSKDPVKDESFYAIEAVTVMLQNAEEFATVPEDFIPLLKNLSYEEGDMELNVRHILKKCEIVMKMKRTQSAGGPIPPQLPRQHSSPAAVTLNDSQPPTPTVVHSSPVEENFPMIRSHSSTQLKDGNLLVQ